MVGWALFGPSALIMTKLSLEIADKPFYDFIDNAEALQHPPYTEAH